MTIETDAVLARMAAAARVVGRLPPTLTVSTDSRTIVPGRTFLALRGERFDGNAYVADAMRRGAVAAIVEDERALPPDMPGIVVPDARVAYLECAAVARRSLRARVIAVTGSTGKTTTKALLAQLTQRCGLLSPALATQANENNEVGVARLFCDAEPDVATIVVEMGAQRYGEIAPLVRVALPAVAILTNVGDSHLATMGSRERLAETKWGIFTVPIDAESPSIPVLNAADAVSRARAERDPFGPVRPPFWFAMEGEALQGLPPQTRAVLVEESSLVYRQDGRERRLARRDGLPGVHNRANLAASLAAVVALGIPFEEAAELTADLAMPPGRYERIPMGDWEVLFDAYNASMDGTLATLRSFAIEPARRRIAVLGSMANLGSESPQMHQRVGRAAARAGLATLLVGGEFADEIARGALDEGFDPRRLVRFERNEVAAEWLRAHAGAGDLVLLKASRRYRLEEIVNALRDHG